MNEIMHPYRLAGPLGSQNVTYMQTLYYRMKDDIILVTWEHNLLYYCGAFLMQQLSNHKVG